MRNRLAEECLAAILTGLDPIAPLLSLWIIHNPKVLGLVMILSADTALEK